MLTSETRERRFGRSVASSNTSGGMGNKPWSSMLSHTQERTNDMAGSARSLDRSGASVSDMSGMSTAAAPTTITLSALWLVVSSSSSFLLLSSSFFVLVLLLLFLFGCEVSTFCN